MTITYKPGIWYGWNGGECPVHPKTTVAVRLRFRGAESASCDGSTARYRDWSHAKSEVDIIAFKILTPYGEPPKPREFWVNEYEYGLSTRIYASKHEADFHNGPGRIRCIKLIEQVEE